MRTLPGMFRLLLAVNLLALLAACSSLGCGDPHPYLNSMARSPLKAPPGLTVPPPNPSYAIQGVTPDIARATGRNAAGVCLINPPQVVPTQQAAAKPVAAPKKTPSVPTNAEPPKPAGQNKTPAPAAGTVPAVPPPLAATGRVQ